MNYKKKPLNLELKNKKLMFIPKLDLILQYSLPFEDSRPENWSLGFRLSYPFLGYSAKSQVYSAFAKKERASSTLDMLKSNMKIDWLNACSRLNFLNKSVKLKKETLDDYTKIMALEEKKILCW